jgi:hypothetical protein
MGLFAPAPFQPPEMAPYLTAPDKQLGRPAPDFGPTYFRPK